MKSKELAGKYKDYVIDLRRHFHMYPESSLEEFETSKRIREELDKMGIPYISLATNGVLATIEGGMEGKTVALRADMDALEIVETNDVPYKSKIEGKMHGCGHDGHTAMLLGAAKILNEIKDEIKGKVYLIFQPAEEVAIGAKAMIKESNFMDEVDTAFAIHLWSEVPVGTVSVDPGPRMASADIFKIKIKGKAGHGSMPNQGVDAVVAGAAIVMDLQSVVSREMNPHDTVVLSVGAFHGGTRFNIIAGEAVLDGTTRLFNPELREQIPGIIERIAKNTAASYRAEASLEYIYGTPPVTNDEECAAIARGAVVKLVGEEGVFEFPKTTGGEDFGYFLEKAPGVIAFVGIRNDEKGINYAHHHDKFDMDEDGLEIGTALYVQYTLDYLNQ